MHRFLLILTIFKMMQFDIYMKYVYHEQLEYSQHNIKIISGTEALSSPGIPEQRPYVAAPPPLKLQTDSGVVSPRSSSVSSDLDGTLSPSPRPGSSRPSSATGEERERDSPHPSGTTAASRSSHNPYAAGLKPRCNSELLQGVDCLLENKDLWDKFHELGTEMIITKTGR